MTQTPLEPDRDPTDSSDSPESPPPSQAETPAADRPKAPDLKTPSGFHRVRYSLFSSETRTGRLLRGVLRALALIVSLFAIGFLVCYLVLYRPTAQQLIETRLQATQTAAELQQARNNLSSVQQTEQSAQNQATQAKAQLEVEVARVQVLRAINSVTQAQLAVQANNKAAAVKALDTAQGYLQAVQPLLEKRDPQQVSTIQALITLSKNDLDRDLKLAGQDLERLQSELQLAETNVLK